jgi:hypothetical protein
VLSHLLLPKSYLQTTTTAAAATTTTATEKVLAKKFFPLRLTYLLF